MHASVLDAVVHPGSSPKHHSNASSGKEISKMPCHDCPILLTGVEGQELLDPASAYSIQPLSYFLNSLIIPMNNLRNCAF